MSWWDDFTNYITNDVVNYWASGGPISGVFTNPGEAAGQLSAGAVEKAVAPALSQVKGGSQISRQLQTGVKQTAASAIDQKVVNPIVEATFTPTRWSMEQIGAGALWEQSLLGGKGLSFQQARNLVQGNRQGKSWYESGEGGVSYGQAIASLEQRILPGQQGTENIDWTDKEAVQKYFSEGPWKYVSGFYDFGGQLVLDPTLWVGGGISKFRYASMARPVISGKQIAIHSFNIDEAVAERTSSWKPMIDMVMNNPDEYKIIQHTFVNDTADAQNLAKALAMAGKSGDRQLVGEILKSSIANTNSIDRLVSRRDKISGLIAARQHTLDRFDDNLIELSQDQIDNITNSLEMHYKEYENLAAVVGSEGKATGAAGKAMNRSVSRFVPVETLRVKAAAARGETVFSSKLSKIGSIPVRTITWLNPSGAISDLPSGVVRLAGSNAATSYKEVQAILRQIGKDMTPLVARKVGKRATSMEFRGAETSFQDIVSQYIRTPDELKNAFLHDLQNDTVYAIVKTHLKRTGVEASTELQLKAARVFAEAVAKNDVIKRSSALSEIVRNKYFSVDKVTSETFHFPQFETWIRDTAAEKGVPYETFVKQIEDNPQLASQMANTFMFIDTAGFNNVLLENQTKLSSLMMNIETTLSEIAAGEAAHGLKVSKAELEAAIRSDVMDALSGKSKLTDIAGSAVIEKGRLTYDTAVALGDAFQSGFWKPLTLISGKYAIRNVLEAQIRSLAYFEELHSLTGVDRKDILTDWLGVRKGEGAIARARMFAGNRAARREAAKSAEQLNAMSSDMRAAARAQDSLVASSRDAAEKQARKVYSTINRLSKYKDKAKVVDGSGILDELTSGESLVVNGRGVSVTDQGATVGTHTHTVYTQRPIYTFKNGEVRRYLILLFDGRIDEANKILTGLKDISSFTNELHTFKNHLEVVADSFTKMLEDNTYHAWLPKNQVALISQYQQDLMTMSNTLETLSATRVAQAAAWGEYSKLAAGAEPILKRTGEGYLLREGALIPDWAHGQLGRFAQADASADRTYAQSVLSSNRNAWEGAMTQKYRNVDILPTDPEWTAAYSHFVSTDLYSDELANMAMRGAGDKEMTDWLASAEGSSYREAFGLNNAHIRRSQLRDQVALVREIVDQYLPEIPNMPAGFLKEHAANGTFTAQVSDMIPFENRSTVIGDHAARLNKAVNLAKTYHNAVGKIFKWIGTVPETTLARVPFLRATYRAEVSRLSRVVADQGKDLTPEIIDRIQRSAHQRAMKTLNETLYTIERKTDMSNLIRFVSPFYMAQQNSSRFWLGQSFKHPYLPYLDLLAWNTPNRILTVRDQNGNSVESSLPFYSNEQIYMTMPKGLLSDWMKALTGNDYITVSKSSMDLITNGNIPMVPSLSGGLISIGLDLIMSNTDVQKRLTDMGMEPDFIETKMLPYIDTYGGFQSALPRPAWANALLSAFGKTPQSAARANLIFEQKMLEAKFAGKDLSTKQKQQTLDNALSETKWSYILESLFSFGSPFSTKLTDKMDLYRKEYTRYIERYGPTDGAILAAKEMGIVKSTYARSSLSDNPGGLISTPQTEDNLKKYMYLAKEITGPGGSEDAMSMLGMMFNEGNSATDYSGIVNGHFYDMDINGRKVKDRNEDLGAAQRRREVSIGWAYWIPFKQAVSARAAHLGIRPGTNDWNNQIAPSLKSAQEVIAKKYPAWAQAKSKINIDRVNNNLRTASYVLKDKKFYNDIGKRNPMWQATSFWLQYRNTLAVALQQRYANGGSKSITAKSNQDILNARDIAAELIMKKYLTFADAYERFFANDNLGSVIE